MTIHRERAEAFETQPAEKQDTRHSRKHPIRMSVCVCVCAYFMCVYMHIDSIPHFDKMKHVLGRYGILHEQRRKRKKMEKQLQFEHIL